jgi:hypothetical protein
LLLSLLQPLAQTGFQTALAGLSVAQAGDRYTDEQLRLSLVWLNAWGVSRLSHINDQPIEPWGVILDTARRPDGDTMDKYLNAVIQQDEVSDEALSGDALPGQVRPGGLIETAQLNSLVGWAQAGLLKDAVWSYDGHVIEYTGQANIGKTKHGTKEKSVKAIKRFTLYNGIAAYNAYFPASETFAGALCRMVTKANEVLPPVYRIRKLAFDREGWDADLLQWLETEQNIVPLTWIKATAPNRRLLADVPQSEFVPLEGEITIGKDEESVHVAQVADTQVIFPDLGQRRVVVLETKAGTRIGLYTAALPPGETTLNDERAMTTVGLLNAMRFKQRIENGFKTEKNEMGSDAIPTHKVHDVLQTEPYDVQQAERSLANAEKRLLKYTDQDEHHQHLFDEGQVNKHEFNILRNRTQRLRNKTEREIGKLKAELDSVEVDQDGQALRSYTSQVLDVRKLTLLNLFKTHALVALHILAQQLALAGAGPVRLRREFLSFGDRVEFDHQRRIMTVYAQRFPRGRTQRAYERLCALLNDLPVTLERDGTSYRVLFSW